jgi:hypothetical protein
MSASGWVGCLAFAGVVVCLSAVLTQAPAQQSTVPATTDVKIAGLRDQLEKGLKARLPREFAFIDRVVGMVDAEQLPYALVQNAFLWARGKRPYPFPYFEMGLRKLAARQGIKI